MTAVKPPIPMPEPSSSTFLSSNFSLFYITNLAKMIPASQICRPSIPWGNMISSFNYRNFKSSDNIILVSTGFKNLSIINKNN